MKLTATEILDKGIITGHLEKDNIQQVGIDLNVVQITNISSGGFIPRYGKTITPRYSEISTFDDPEHKCKIWFLSPGMYQITFLQGCKIPCDCSLDLYPRSSLARIGGQIVSPEWDPGFETEQMTSFMVLHKTVKIEVGSRLVQACVTTNKPLSDKELYSGQWQGQ